MHFKYQILNRCTFVFLPGIKNSCRGFGYVTFALAEDAQRAKDVVKTFGGRQLTVCFANKKPKHEKRRVKRGENPEADNDGSLSKLHMYMYMVYVNLVI